MNSIWGNLYDKCKDRRYAALFLVTLIIFFGLAIPGVILYLQTRAFAPPLVTCCQELAFLSLLSPLWFGG